MLPSQYKQYILEERGRSHAFAVTFWHFMLTIYIFLIIFPLSCDFKRPALKNDDRIFWDSQHM